MVDITHKRTSLRWAIAEAIVRVSKPDTIQAIKDNRVPKGNVFEMAKTAGLLGVKKTPMLIPDCHPIPVEYSAVEYSMDGLDIRIRMEVKAIYRTGVEVEAMHGVSVVALTLYDMLKPIDKGVVIKHIRLLDKTGGKSDLRSKISSSVKTALIVCSDAILSGQKEDKITPLVRDFLKSYELDITKVIHIPDEELAIQDSLKQLKNHGMILMAGGTGLTPTDKTPEVVRPLLDREIPGIGETIRHYGDHRTPKSIMSRALGGMMGDSLLLALPGSTAGMQDALNALFPYLLTIVDKLNKAYE